MAPYLAFLGAIIMLANHVFATEGFWDTRFKLNGVYSPFPLNAACASGGKLFVAGMFDQAGGAIAHNIAMWDGERWSSFGDANGWVRCIVEAEGVLYVGGTFTAIGGIHATNVASWNGREWQALGAGLTPTVMYLTVVNGRLYAGVADDSFASGGRALGTVAVWDGQSWQGVGAIKPVNGLTILHSSADKLIAAGSFRSISGVSATNIAAWDGAKWTSLGEGIPGASITALQTFDGKLIAAAALQSGFFSLLLWEGNAWKPLPMPESFTLTEVSGLLAYEGRLWAFGHIKTKGADSIATCANFDGHVWEAATEGLEIDDGKAAVNGLVGFQDRVVAVGRFLYSGKTNLNAVAQFDGKHWLPLEQQGNYQGIVTGAGTSAMCEWEGKLLVAGKPLILSRSNSANIALWDDRDWAPFVTNRFAGGGIGILKSFKGDLIAAGSFTNIDGLEAKRIATFSRNAWNELGGGIYSVSNNFGLEGPFVGSLELINSNIVVAGLFGKAGSQDVNSIAIWDGAEWNSMQGGVRVVNAPTQVNRAGVVYALCGDSAAGVFAGGSFNIVGGIPATNLARWQGNHWSPVNNQLNGTVRALLYRKPKLYVGGSFKHDPKAAGRVDYCVATWDGADWQELNGIDGALSNGLYSYSPNVDEITSLGNDIVVSGTFANAGGFPARMLALWNGETWQSLQGGITGKPRSAGLSLGFISSILSFNSRLYVAGSFTSVGTVPSTDVACWRPKESLRVRREPDGSVSIEAEPGGDLEASNDFKRWKPREHQSDSVTVTPTQSQEFFRKAFH